MTWGTNPEDVLPIDARVPDPAVIADPVRAGHVRDAIAYMGLRAGQRLQEIAVDLHTCRVHAGAEAWDFTLDPVSRTKLLNGWDDLDPTASHAAAIAAFAAFDALARPWMPPLAREATTRV